MHGFLPDWLMWVVEHSVAILGGLTVLAVIAGGYAIFSMARRLKK